MPENDGKIAAQCVVIGVVAGLRSMMAPAVIIADIAAKDPEAKTMKWLSVISSMTGKNFSALNGLGELIADKLPFIPARTQTGSVIFRCLSGAFAGGALSASRKKSLALGAGLGLVGALIGTYGGYHTRKWIGETSKIPDPFIGLAEDGIALSLGKIATI